MAQAALLDNVIGWAQFKLRGGWRSILTTTIAFVVVVVGLISLSLRIDPQSASNALYYWTMALMGVQLGLLILFGGSAVRSAVRRDMTTGMIESHRLMPVPGTHAVAGYILGATAQATAIALANLLVGVAVAGAGGVGVGDWLFANVIAAVFAACAWTAVALFSFMTAGAFGLLIIFLVICFVSGGVVFAVLPGLTVVTGPMIGKSVFGIIERGASWGPVYPISFGAQFVVGLLFFAAAARRYRRDDVLAFTPGMGLCLVALWVGLSVMGMHYRREFEPTLMGRSHMPREIQLIGSMLAAILVALVPVSAAAWTQSNHQRRRLLGDPTVGRRPIPANLIVVAASMIALVLPIMVEPEKMLTVDRLVRTGLSIAAFLLAVSYLLRILYRVTAKAATPTFVYLLFAWIGPLVIDGIRFGMLGLRLEDEFCGVISGCSPIGTIMYLWEPSRISTTPGLVVQFVPAVILALLFHATQPRRLPPEARPAGVQLRPPTA